MQTFRSFSLSARIAYRFAPVCHARVKALSKLRPGCLLCSSLLVCGWLVERIQLQSNKNDFLQTYEPFKETLHGHESCRQPSPCEPHVCGPIFPSSCHSHRTSSINQSCACSCLAPSILPSPIPNVCDTSSCKISCKAKAQQELCEPRWLWRSSDD